MDYSVHFFDEVKLDIREAKDWYKKQKSGLEKHFAQEVKKSIIRLQKNPEIYEIRYKNIRTIFTAIFPYSIHFFIDEKLKKIVIIAILHQARNPVSHHNRNQ
ncbi:plasmid stabilization system protein ParE [Pedobacter psychrotolerans]|uniref:Plasmid stabilization system protein ParE n=1 Tax=Pedobacter psychrotolerans TaxID=1843235 RepID=A0A4R2HKX0_9SPHI|nr:type II toxin-antitoxin system RelE/ParE family toxin [Pedobacter psychrotolerans]TCO30699.1 plasmid stabilization system protein ParE [Pedobacter psychrotolerans]GGE68188.1 hypothetical protein GCM10011413_38560 [Pedobacter psychrotolerans]